ncbi:MAG: HigA family addiction module antitoxin [Thermodesulfobacteriota bacterium]
MKNDKTKLLEPTSPGEVLIEEILEPLKMNPTQLANKLNVPPGRIHDIIKGKRAITPDTDYRLSKYLNIEPGFFMRLQVIYDMKKIKPDIEKVLKEIQPREKVA